MQLKLLSGSGLKGPPVSLAIINALWPANKFQEMLFNLLYVGFISTNKSSFASCFMEGKFCTMSIKFRNITKRPKFEGAVATPKYEHFSKVFCTCYFLTSYTNFQRWKQKFSKKNFFGPPKYEWYLCADLKIIRILLKMQGGFTKHCCFHCLWDSRATAKHYVGRDWPARITYIPGNANIKMVLLADSKNVLHC